MAYSSVSTLYRNIQSATSRYWPVTGFFSAQMASLAGANHARQSISSVSEFSELLAELTLMLVDVMENDGP
jgi:hypothetical protein